MSLMNQAAKGMGVDYTKLMFGEHVKSCPSRLYMHGAGEIAGVPSMMCSGVISDPSFADCQDKAQLWMGTMHFQPILIARDSEGVLLGQGLSGAVTGGGGLTPETYGEILLDLRPKA